ncbi:MULTISPECIES: heavy metal translocating P-type ATPase metal-binding domain-containing protein [Eikenella]
MSHTESQANTCFHCGLPVPRGLDLPIEFEGVCHPACCAGC